MAQKQVEYWAWDIRVPSSDPWPSSLPVCQALKDFYQICDGGCFHWFTWPPLSQLVPLNSSWFRLLSAYDERGDVLLPERHVVLALDSGGAPVIWDVSTNQVAAFFPKGGDWEPPLASSIEAFLATLFNPKDDGDWWGLFLQQLDTI
ncbi:SMI1/KNR4 family protein [Ktedonobacter racemifer]|uniref:SMI1/KNR4 family protein n=1 Tax=Ktedonobacter racemifer TaxID=363277 RepID=UPI001FCB042A|nr:SMI1/KNR4 family protein [Ktedonobacter racemifer]